jgi:hypothetical protein
MGTNQNIENPLALCVHVDDYVIGYCEESEAKRMVKALEKGGYTVTNYYVLCTTVTTDWDAEKYCVHFHDVHRQHLCQN